MLARQFLVGTVAELFVYALITIAVCEGRCSFVEVGIWILVIYLSVRLVLTAASFGITGIVGAPRPKDCRIGLVRALWMCLEEWLSALLVFSVLQPCERLLAMRDPPPGARGSSNPILLVHGFLGNGAVWWGLRRRLVAEGIGPVYTLNLEPTTGAIEDLARRLKARLEEILAAEEGAKVTLVCHSMGGLVARVLVEQLGGSDGVHAIVTVGTPHHGTVLARLLGGANVCQMRRNSNWLLALNGSDAPSPSVPLISLYSYHDNIVAPQESSRLPWADNRPLVGIGHVALLYAPRSQKAIIESLRTR